MLNHCIHIARRLSQTDSKRDTGIRRFRNAGKYLSLVILGSLLLSPFTAVSPGAQSRNPYEVEAAFLHNFVRYVNWPEAARPDSQGAWCIGILGQDPFGEILEQTLAGRSVKGRPLEIHRAMMMDRLPSCQVVFIAYDDAIKRRVALNTLKDKPVLSVGNAQDFLQEGGIIQLEISDTVQMNINLDQARASSLSIQTKMLEVSHQIIENGIMRRVR